ncbi:hypothetical protein K2173_027371 [Erythroxylum novogranatense]|uniref:Uncharacterized protein n=1 Tax=Erythroxylum novogranatense TaxID=1862640 RepID=A0AAV8U1V3_9ROSI|nr:hypothetical protein K2173_027371 [Erythroxylum novogranatense]
MFNQVCSSSNTNDSPTNWSRLCDTCRSAACVLYCCTDSVYLCQTCDQSVHGASQHERVCLCTACENAPAAFTCQADEASLCINCDIEIHSANPLARRHNRVPIPPFPRTVNPTSTDLEGPNRSIFNVENSIITSKTHEELVEEETDSWLLLDLDDTEDKINSEFTYGEEADEYLDFAEYNSCMEHQCQDHSNHQQQNPSVCQGVNASDSVVPVQSFEAKRHLEQQQQQPPPLPPVLQHSIYLDKRYEAHKAAFINVTSDGQRVPMPYPSNYFLKGTSNVSNTLFRYMRGTKELFPKSSLLMPLQFSPSSRNREARVLRYREKRKVRTFEKKIRYASRKANAEARPRVKGRFARKMDSEFEVDQMYSASAEEYGYRIVPSY